MNPILEEIKPETAERLAALAKARGKTVDELVKSFLPPINGHPDDGETIGERLERKGLLGIIDSSELDPSSPPQRSPLYELIAEKFRKQGLKLP